MIIIKKSESKRLPEANIIWEKRALKFYLNVYGNEISLESLQSWFSDFLFFKPVQMGLFCNGRGDIRRYKEDRFNENLVNAVGSKSVHTLKLYNADCSNYLEALIEPSSALFEMRFSLDLWEERKEEIINTFENLFVALGGCFGYLVNCFDDEIVQNPMGARQYILYGVDDNDLANVDQIPLLPPLTPMGDNRIDPNYLPGHRLRYDRMMFAPAPYMWFGPDSSTFFSKKHLDKFKDCEENVEFAPGYRRICLWEDVAEYNAPIYRDRQWSFRKKTKMDDILKELTGKPFRPKNENAISSPMVELKKGKFEHGGTLLGIFYLDNNGKPCTKENAYACVEREMDGHTVVWQERRKL